MGLVLQDALRLSGPARTAPIQGIEVILLLLIVGCVILHEVSHDDWGIVKWTGFVVLSIIFGIIYTIGVNSGGYQLDKERWFLFRLMSIVGAAYVVVSVAKKAMQQNKGKILLWWVVTFSVQVGTCIPFVWKKLVEVAAKPVINILVEVIYLMPVWIIVLIVIGLFTLVVLSQQE